MLWGAWFLMVLIQEAMHVLLEEKQRQAMWSTLTAEEKQAGHVEYPHSSSSYPVRRIVTEPKAETLPHSSLILVGLNLLCSLFPLG